MAKGKTSNQKSALRPPAVYRTAKALAEGLDVASLDDDALAAFDHPEFSGALIAAFHHKLATGHLPKALKALDELLASGNERVRLQAAKLVLDKTLPDISNLQPGAGKDLNSMTMTELQALVDKMEKTIGIHAKVVDSAPSESTRESQLAEILS